MVHTTKQYNLSAFVADLFTHVIHKFFGLGRNNTHLRFIRHASKIVSS